MVNIARLPLRVAAWASALIMAVLPIAAGFDFGGILWWTQHAIGLAICVAASLALGTLVTDRQVTLTHQRILLPLLLWIGFASLHCMSASQTFVQWVSPATRSAYTEWLPPLVEPQGSVESIPLSIAPDQTSHSVSFLMLLMPLAWAAGRVFSHRRLLGGMLFLFSVGPALHAGYGFLCLLFPDWSFRPVSASGNDTGFGGFVNRNNIALHFNFGLATGLGLLSWRIASVIGQQIDAEDFELNDLLSLLNDRGSIIAVASVAFCFAGLLACGSRSGIASMLAGTLFAFGLVRQRRGWLHLPLALVGIGLVVAILVVPFGDRATTVERIDEIDVRSGEGIVENQRWGHWADAFRTMWAHFPAGSGLGTYAFAYLPHQETSSGAWFHHADNLWLEMGVEQGIPGILLAFAVLVLIILALRKLSFCPDPIDQGLRTAGWFSIGAVIASQVLDFGLIVPANLTLFVILFAVIVSRSELQAVPPLEEENHEEQTASNFYANYSDPRAKAKFPRLRSRVVSQMGSIAVAIAAIVLGWMTIPRLRDDAIDDALIRQSDLALEASFSDVDVLNESLKQLQRRIDGRPTAELLFAHARVQHQAARLNEVFSQNITDPNLAVKAYENTKRSVHRKAWRHPELDIAPLDQKTLAFYQPALESSRACLLRSPLHIHARAEIIYLDFIHQDPELTRTTLEQLAMLQRRGPEQLIELAKWAVGGDDSDLAQKYWRNATALNPLQSRFAIDFVRQNPSLSLIESVDENPVALRLAGRLLVAARDEDDPLQPQISEFIKHTIGKLKCDQCESRREASRCHETAGEIYSKLGNESESIIEFQKAVDLSPTNASLRARLITHLRKAGRNKEALEAAQRARAQIPGTEMFDEMIRSMANEDIKEAAERNNSSQ